MFQVIDSKIIFIMFFIIIILFTIYYIFSTNFKERNFGLLITSFIQGLLLSVIFPNYLFMASILALVYFLFFSYFWNIKFIFKSRRLDVYNDGELIRFLRKIPELKNFEFELKKYSGINSFNANVIPPIPFISNKVRISFGEQLISKLTLEEKLFVIAHEISHALNKHFLKKGILVVILIIVLSYISFFFNLIALSYAKNYFVLFDYINTSFFFIIGIIGINLISWRYEYDADKKGVYLTKDSKNFESGLLKLEECHPLKSYGTIINLIVYTHPVTNDRIKKMKRKSLKSKEE